jgi:hypothetical protein
MQTMGRTVRIGCSSGFWGDTPTAVPQLLYGGQLQVRGQCRNQYCGSMTFWCGSGSRSADPCLWLMDPDPGSGSCYFRHRPSRCQQKTNLFFNFFCLILFEGTVTSFFKDKMSKRVTKQQDSRFFLLFLHNDRRIRIRIREALKHGDPDPQHWPQLLECVPDPDSQRCQMAVVTATLQKCGSFKSWMTGDN